MKSLRHGLVALSGALLWLFSMAVAHAEVAVPALQAHVTDLTATLSAAEKATLESMLASFEANKGAQVAVLIVPTTEPEAIEQYSLRVAEAWKLGRAQPDDGVLLLIAKNDHRMRIEVGYGLEGALNDATCRRIIAEDIAPHFKAGDFAGGVRAGLTRMLAVINGEVLPAPADSLASAGKAGGKSGSWIVGALIFALAAAAILPRSIGRVLVGLVAGAVVYGFTSLLLLSLFLAFITWLLWPAVNMASSDGIFYGSRHHGGFGGGGFGGGGGGGFSGGGGSFGGGGASGGW